MRLSASDHIRRAASRTLDATSGVGEADVALTDPRSGIPAVVASAVFHNDLGQRRRGIVDVPGHTLKPRAAQLRTSGPWNVM